MEFQRGVRLLDERHFGEAVAAFERSLAIREGVAALYNLGLAHRGNGAARLSLDAFERFLARAAPNNPARRGAAVMVSQLRRSLARVSVTALGGSDEVRVDDERVATADGRFERYLDPGLHSFEARRPDHHPTREERTLSAGDTVQVTLDASARPIVTRLVDALPQPSAALEASVEVRRRVLPASPAPQRSLLRNGWFWVGVGVGAVVLAGVVIAIVEADSPAGTGPAYNGGSWNTVLQGSTSGP